MDIPKFSLQAFLSNKNDAFHIARTTLTSKSDIRLHSHDYVEIFWIENGKGIHYLNGTEEKIKAGYLCLIRPEDTHTFASVEDSIGITILNIAFPQSALTYFRSRYKEQSNKYFDIKSNTPFAVYLSEQNLMELSRRANELTNVEKNNLALDNFLTSVFLLLEDKNTIKIALPHWLQLAIENFATPDKLKLGSKGFIELTKMNKDHVNRTIKKYFNFTLTEYVNQIRLQYAKNQLTMTNESIKSICYDCGYSSLVYFYKIFRKHYGATPNEFRNKYHKIF